jgi:hypothetical protein
MRLLEKMRFIVEFLGCKHFTVISSKLIIYIGVKHFPFVPKTYILPGESSKLVEEMQRDKNILWIVKPNALS